jgi:hypothetical protein
LLETLQKPLKQLKEFILCWVECQVGLQACKGQVTIRLSYKTPN